MSKHADLSPWLRDAVSRETLGKSVSWTGQPDPRAVFQASLPLYFFAIPWTAFAVFWMAGAAGIWGRASKSSPGSMGFALFGLPFVLIGLGMLAAPFWAGRKAKSTAYVITGDSLLTIVANWNSVDVKTTPLASIIEIERHEKRNGTGTLKLHVGWRKDNDGDNVKSHVDLTGIPDVRRVETLLRRHERLDAPRALDPARSKA